MKTDPETSPSARDYRPCNNEAHKHGAVGQPISRLDGPLKVQGKAPFAADVSLSGLLFGSLLYSTIARGSIATIDTIEAERAPGVVLVMTYKNAPRMHPPRPTMSAPKAAAPSELPIMQNPTIHWNGEAVAVVLAETQEQADHAKSLIHINYNELPAVTSFDAAKANSRTPAMVIGQPPVVEIGDAEAALKEAPYKVDQIYRTPRHNHNAIELHAATASWVGDNLTIHDATQKVTHSAWTLAQVFGIEERQVRVISPYVGGGFGGKGLWYHQVLAAAAARLAGRPVRIVLSREGVFRIVGGRTVTEQRVALGANADGHLMALIHTGVSAMTAHNNMAEPFTHSTRHLYAAKAFKIVQEVADMNMIANAFMRAPGESVGTFAVESAIDELAETMQLDPIDLRERMEPTKDPTSGLKFSSRHLVEAYRRGAERFGWQRRLSRPRARQEGDWLVGLGVATATYPYIRMPGGAARIKIYSDGRAVAQMASQEMGMGTATVQAQHISQRLGLPIEMVTFEYGDSSLPDGTIAGGSSQTVSIARAIMAACDVLASDLLKIAGNDTPLAGLTADEVEFQNGGLSKKGQPEIFESFVSILRRAGRDVLASEAAAPPPLEMKEYSMHSWGAHFCEARVNTLTGEIRIPRILGSYDCGRILNPKTATSQFKGGIIMGLGLALTEETLFDERSGRIMNRSLAEYHVPVHLDVPDIDVIWTDIPDPCSPLGARGIGEIGITGVGAAVANAIYNATGKRVHDLPITLDKLLD
ncbi:xanthine dehydrogenase family protein molybdopterin-binding subunit [Bradyrhizobium sp. WSM3983]|uniref:xanthine dehydrogenase family protein molybdopterin-binding subunit n=1 Tax=Bradyrhizobium sp. WSM3983 TaxID=1038867 RepID=UPI00040D2A38|nr:xanthine dehydrogenase family protein molybdopterin-binding subunit [Bradyrhizobium sp. WSM3983]